MSTKRNRIYPPRKQLVSLRLPPELVKCVKVLADQSDQTLTDWVRDAIEARVQDAPEHSSASAV